MADQSAQPLGWCIVELLGHRKVAAHVTETTVAGAGMLRLDEPATVGREACTQFVSPASLYAIHPTTEVIVTAMAGRWRQDPVSRWELPSLLRPALEANSADAPSWVAAEQPDDDEWGDDDHA